MPGGEEDGDILSAGVDERACGEAAIDAARAAADGVDAQAGVAWAIGGVDGKGVEAALAEPMAWEESGRATGAAEFAVGCETGDGDAIADTPERGFEDPVGAGAERSGGLAGFGKEAAPGGGAGREFIEEERPTLGLGEQGAGGVEVGSGGVEEELREG